MGSVNIDDYESRQYMDRMLQSAGIYAKLEEMGIEEGAPVVIGEFEFEYVYYSVRKRTLGSSFFIVHTEGRVENVVGVA